MRQFKCLMPKVISFGPGKARELARSVAGKKILVMGDPGVKSSGAVRAALDAIGADAAAVREFWDIVAEPTEQQITDIVAAVDMPGLDAIVAVGGGSAMDTAKFVSVMAQGGPSMEDLFAGRFSGKRKASLIMVPTTAGSGSEATPNSIALRPKLNLKVGVVCEEFMADQVILDPELLVGLPPNVTAATGLDALCHALECYVSNKANPVSDMFAMESMRLTFKSLRTAVADGADIEARGETQLAAFYGGVCIACSGTNAVHALSYPLGGRYRIPHGVSNAVLLAPVFAYNKDACVEKLAMVADLAARASGTSLGGMNDSDKADYLVDYLARLAQDLKIPASLEELGIGPEDLDLLVDAAFEVKRLLDNNPKPLSKDDIRVIYTGILTRRS
ncbi:MAG: iron-containing alcohol dehydrogenase [Methylobacteriaceae bacterium]|jgi:alcohol dehydrogenase class IV|nr:iron-containing alcohol dehydrogenase [Methylobacteriaceae bacterium]